MRKSVAAALLGFTMALEAQSPTPAVYFYASNGALTTEGTWVPVDPKEHAAFLSETQVDCLKETNTCVEATAEDYAGYPHISIDYFAVVKWDANSIIATNSDAICVTRTLSVSFAGKRISDSRELKVLSAGTRKACKDLAIPDAATWVLALRNSPEWTSERERKHKAI